MGGPGEIETKEVPLMSPEQQKILSQLLGGTMNAMQGMNLGQGYGGPVASSWQPQPFMGPKDPSGGRIRQTGGLPGGGMAGPGMRGKMKGMRPGAGGIRNRPGGVQSESSLMANLLAGPMPNTMTQGMTGNFPRRPGGMGR